MARVSRPGDPSVRRFQVWVIGPWVILLLAAFGAVQYLRHENHAYLAAAMLVVVVCAGCILRQSWSRLAMQVLAVLLAAWAGITGVLMLQQWGDFEIARQQVQASAQLGDMALWMIERAERTWRVALAFKLLAVPPLLWLAWQMGRSAVRAQFRLRRPQADRR